MMKTLAPEDWAEFERNGGPEAVAGMSAELKVPRSAVPPAPPPFPPPPPQPPPPRF